MSQRNPFEVIRSHGLVPVVEVRDASTAADLARALVAGGLPLIEITMRTEAAAAAMRAASALRSTILLGAGTVTSVEQVLAAVDAGAEFIVSPGLNPRVVEECLNRSIPVLPGVCTPTEIETARNYGLKVLKFFPAEAYGGVKTLKALGDVYRGFGFVPTGGINLQNLGDYLKLPSVVACGGSWMAPADAIASRKFEEIEATVRAAVAQVGALRGEKAAAPQPAIKS
jgi:2-dehydro-3-deoxyphosphogluconate aldolase/(4S)-4-hydroxy-2-oxoglutarate aldolase